MLTRRILLAAIAASSAYAVAAAASFERRTFDANAFQAAKSAGRSILIQVSAPWCPTCRAQKPILAELASKPKFGSFVFFEVDFDSQKDVLRMLNVHQQSTLITFKGANEVGRSTGDTNAASIEDLLNKAI
jgi:thiol-disulfide isomerase/thioredoxin